MRSHGSIEHLRDVGLFSGCSDRELQRVDRLTCTEDVAAGTVLCKQGVFGRESFVIVSGHADVSIDCAPIATLGPGSFFGELSVLDGYRRAATVTAATPMTVLVLSGQELEALLADVPRVGRKMLAAMGSRLRLADRVLGASSSQHS